MNRILAPLHNRIILLVRSRTRGLGATFLLMCVMALLALRANSVFFWFTGTLISYVAIPLTLAASRDEMIGADAGLWLQKPVREVSFVFARFAETVTTTVVLSVLFAGASTGIAMAAGWDPETPLLLSAPAGALASFTMASMAFGAAVWLPRGSRAVVLFLIVMGLLNFDTLFAQPEGSRNWLQLISRFVFFPAPELIRLGAGLTGALPFRVHNLAVPLAYATSWIGIGILGVLHSVKRGRIGYDRAR